MIKKYLNQPYPRLLSIWKLIISISLFIALFMLIFQPFGLSDYQNPNKTLVIIGYGLVAFVILTANLILLPIIFKTWFDLNRWTVKKELLWLTWIIFTIGAGNYFYSNAIFSIFQGYEGFLIFQFFTIAIGIIPIIFVTVINQNIKLSYYLKEAKEFNADIKAKTEQTEDKEVVCLLADNGREKLEIEQSDLLLIESVGNYVKAYYLDKGKLTSSLLRSTLKRIESQLKEHRYVVKCHRAFLVNVKHIEHVKGNSQGLKLIMSSIDFEIPVSRNYSAELKERVHAC